MTGAPPGLGAAFAQAGAKARADVVPATRRARAAAPEEVARIFDEAVPNGLGRNTPGAAVGT